MKLLVTLMTAPLVACAVSVSAARGAPAPSVVIAASNALVASIRSRPAVPAVAPIGSVAATMKLKRAPLASGPVVVIGVALSATPSPLASA